MSESDDGTAIAEPDERTGQGSSVERGGDAQAGVPSEDTELADTNGVEKVTGAERLLSTPQIGKSRPESSKPQTRCRLLNHVMAALFWYSVMP
ncbi:hypothetical protein F441_19729 [Phytophthora nicotianae CJ01A1]|uniref:Uncharacterized protein n=5 Tax=Phytophthora nicotianae TaxID=4792 RepID=V9E2X3_PHYNI|nr:hypothetical protein F443_19872 [Phytophthora nicotianae P1569]ETK73789.1 hypothetical protein L915_19323 [Phytophthora nicotianae]ETO62220.1 hypothetical protein F444_19862 [Phytophthora nicotianae P1976]ETP03306.1 hypothetical protein F441_19729 [Phytophthora nicotianae CJ01A1]ETP31465.1 hypothetical protein F442_19682 [Phytophthora nicotianae P10297]